MYECSMHATIRTTLYHVWPGRETDAGPGLSRFDFPFALTIIHGIGILAIRVLYRVFRLQTFALLKLLVLISKKLAFKFTTYIFEYRSLPTHIHCTSTHVMNAPRTSLFFTGFPLLCIIVMEGKNGGGLGTRLLLHVVSIKTWYSIPVATTLTCTLISTT